MSTEIKFMNKSEEYKYFADKLTINHWAFIDKKIKSQSFRCPAIKSFVSITRKSGKTRINFSSNFNMNRIIREWGLDTFDMRGGTSTFVNEDNFIPRNLRHYLIKHQYTHRYLREQAIRIIFERLDSIELEIKQKLWHKFQINRINIFRSLKLAEISFDIESLASIEFAKSRELKGSFDRHVRSSSQVQFLMNGESTFPAHEHNSLKSAKSEAETGREYIACKHWDNTRGKVYTKEISKDIVLNRIERVFDGRPQISKYIKNSFRCEQDLKNIIKVLANETFNTFFPIMNIPITFTEKSNNKLIKIKCRDHFGKNYDAAYRDLTTVNKAITTGKNGKSIKAVQNRARVLAKAGIFLKCERRGLYVVDMKHLKVIPVS